MNHLSPFVKTVYGGEFVDTVVRVRSAASLFSGVAAPSSSASVSASSSYVFWFGDVLCDIVWLVALDGDCSLGSSSCVTSDGTMVLVAATCSLPVSSLLAESCLLIASMLLYWLWSQWSWAILSNGIVEMIGDVGL